MSPPRLRIGLVVGGWWPQPGGVESVTRGLAAALMARGHRVFALGFDAQLALGETRDERVGGVQLRRISAASRELLRAADLERRPELEQLAARWCAEHELELVHAHDLSGWGPGTLVGLARLGLAVHWTWHDYGALCPRGQLWHVSGERCERAEPEACAPCVAQTWPQLGETAQLTSILERRAERAREASRACARVYAPSRAAREVFERHGFEVDDVELCENGVGVASGSIVREGDASGAQRIRVGVLGSVQPSKGVLELARWIAELGAPFELHVHGPRADYHGDRTYVRALEELAAREARIVLHGIYDEPGRAAALAQLDLVAVPSLWEEVYGLGAREARAAGLPVFASAIGGLVEEGLYPLPPGDGAAWRSALARFAADPAWRQELRGAPLTPRSPGEMAEQLLAGYTAAL